MNALIRFVTALSLLTLSLASMAENMEMRFYGNLLEGPPCEINSGRLITVAFGDVQTARIDGSYKTITIPYTLDCSRAVTNAVRMQVSGAGASFKSSLLAIPGNAELGIALKKDGAAFAINTWADFDGGTRPVLQAVLSKRAADSEIKGGALSASATLVVEYR